MAKKRISPGTGGQRKKVVGTGRKSARREQDREKVMRQLRALGYLG